MKELETLMTLRRWSQAELARRFQVNESTISRWRSGKAVPNKPTLKLIALYLMEAQMNHRKEKAQ